MSFLQQKPQQRLNTMDARVSSQQCESDDDDDESVPPSPASSVASDASTGSWGKMSQISRGPPAIKRHSEYYIESGDVVFLVETQLFKVHSYFFVRESSKFREMLHMPARSGFLLKSSSDSNPFELRDVTPKEFTRFLWIFYNPNYNYDASISKWASILRLAHIWKFPRVKDLAVREMDKLDIEPVDKAVMAREFEVDLKRRWLETSYAALGAREQPLTKEEGLRLGLDVVLHLAEVRERIRERRRLAAEERERNTSMSNGSDARSGIPPHPASVLQELERIERAQVQRYPPLTPMRAESPVPELEPVPESRYHSNAPSRRGSPVASERSYDSYNPRMAESMYLPPKPIDTPPVLPPDAPYGHSQNMNSSRSGQGSSLGPGSLTTLPTTSRSLNRSNLSSSASKRFYTEEDVSAVKEVFSSRS